MVYARDHPKNAAFTQSLKQVKNAVIGNLSKKAEVAQDEGFIRTPCSVQWVGLLPSGCLLGSYPPVRATAHKEMCKCKRQIEGQTAREQVRNCLNLTHAPPEIRIEAVRVLASLAYGTDDSLVSLLRARTHQALIYALAHIQPTDPPALALALARALRAVMCATADVLGPPLWGLRVHYGRGKGRRIDILDTLLPHLNTPNTQLRAHILNLFASCTRSTSLRARQMCVRGGGRRLLLLVLGIVGALVKADREGYVPLDSVLGYAKGRRARANAIIV
ncbi:hypothetical protein BDQ17DRAFT_1412659 [Cyathus striatus]|nr:hypothetical protein BDQ17DRAFT_1412659 [Cyathus striatus]